MDKKKVSLPSLNKSRKEVKFTYVRYADDFIFLTNCTRKMATTLKDLMEAFLKEELLLELSKEKTLITNLEQKGAKFLAV